jgi:hypothetical protein
MSGSVEAWRRENRNAVTIREAVGSFVLPILAAEKYFAVTGH